jgi:hypothetical protein
MVSTISTPTTTTMSYLDSDRTTLCGWLGYELLEDTSCLSVDVRWIDSNRQQESASRTYHLYFGYHKKKREKSSLNYNVSADMAAEHENVPRVLYGCIISQSF